jgi:hypothetical protein
MTAKTVFIKISSHRANQKFNALNVPYISLWSMLGHGSAATSLVMIYAEDVSKLKGIKCISILSGLPKRRFSWNSRREEEKLHQIFENLQTQTND